MVQWLVGANEAYILEKLVNVHCVSAVLAMYVRSQIYEMFIVFLKFYMYVIVGIYYSDIYIDV